jgi:tetratricopeptide (TPR) repeat protein
MRINESWLMFQKGRLAEAGRILDQVRTVLDETDDYVSLGNIQSAYGRIARRHGRNDRALEHFAAAIALYRRRDPHHRNLARSLTNVAWAKRLLSVQLQSRIDEELARRKGGTPRRDPGASRFPEDRVELERLRTEALAELDEAEAIYSRTGDHRGCAAVQLNRGFLHLDNGEIDRAASESAESYTLAEEIHDYIPMARARVLQCIVENALFEEQIGESADMRRHAQRAFDYVHEALEIASRTQDKRLLARAHVWQGLTYMNPFFNNPEAARQCCDAASAILRQQGPEVVWDDLQDLRTRVLRSAHVETALREWSEGLIADKTFQQMTEDFAAIVIPRVWEREGRKVSRVAEKLSVSPKKVRRVLQNAGLLRTSRDGESPV